MIEEIKLVLATADDAQVIHQMQYEAFLPLYEKYHDDETSPAKESLDTVIWKITQPDSEYWLIQSDCKNVGAVRVVKDKNTTTYNRNCVKWISPIFILPEFQNRGIGQLVIKKIFEAYPEAITFRLATIKQETGNCYLYEKCGFVRTLKEHIVNEEMTLVYYEKSNVRIRRFEDKDAENISNLIVRNFMEVNSRDYGITAMKELAQSHDAAWVKQVAGYAHMYVFEWKNQIIGVGSISSYWGSETESILLTIFVLPELHGNGIGRTIIRTLESDELFTRASRIEIPASITGVEFYRRFGYDFKNGIKELDAEGQYRLEKFRKVE